MRVEIIFEGCERLPANPEADGFRAKFAQEAPSRKNDAGVGGTDYSAEELLGLTGAAALAGLAFLRPALGQQLAHARCFEPTRSIR